MKILMIGLQKVLLGYLKNFKKKHILFQGILKNYEIELWLNNKNYIYSVI